MANSANDLFKHAYSLINPEQKKKEWYEEMEEQVCSYCPQMTFSQRVVGALTTMTIGFLISMGSTLRLFELLKGNPDPFAITYTIGNIVGICSTCFIYGPWTQAKKMFAPTRLVSTGIYLFFMGLTLFLAFYPKEVVARLLWLVLSIMCQFLALVWYTLSFIPFARDLVKTCLRDRCCCSCCAPQDDDGWF